MIRLSKHKFWSAALLSLLLLQLLSLVLYERDQYYLKKLMDDIVGRDAKPSEQAEAIVAFLREKPDRDNPRYFLLPVFRFLRPTPRQIAEDGGWCSDRSRLAVVLLQLRGIHASKWALYSAKGVPRHAVVEVASEGGKMVVDPLFGLWFPEPAGGGFYSIEEMRDHPEILKARIDLLISQGADPGSQPLKQYPLERYSYAHSRTINWEKSYTFKMFYRLFYTLIGPAVDDLPRPGWAEQPALMLIYILVPLQILILIFWKWTGTRRSNSVTPTLMAQKSRAGRTSDNNPHSTDSYLPGQR